MKKIFRKVQFLSYIATIVIALILSVTFVKQLLFSSAEPVANTGNQRAAAPPAPNAARPASPVNPVGKLVPIDDVNWKENKRTLVLYISTTCRFCTESGPFYSQLAENKSLKGVKIVAVMPQPVEEGKKYLQKLDVNIKNIYNSSLVSIGVSSTPTLLLVNEDGIVSDSWRGRLAPEKEEEILAKLTT